MATNSGAGKEWREGSAFGVHRHLLLPSENDNCLYNLPEKKKTLLQRSVYRCAVPWHLISFQTEFPGSYFILSSAPAAAAPTRPPVFFDRWLFSVSLTPEVLA